MKWFWDWSFWQFPFFSMQLQNQSGQMSTSVFSVSLCSIVTDLTWWIWSTWTRPLWWRQMSDHTVEACDPGLPPSFGAGDLRRQPGRGRWLRQVEGTRGSWWELCSLTTSPVSAFNMSRHTHTRWAAAGSQRSSRWRDCSLDAPAIVLGNQLLRSIYLKTGTAHIYSITSHCNCNAVRIFRPCITLNHKYNIHPSKLISLTDWKIFEYVLAWSSEDIAAWKATVWPADPPRVWGVTPS